MALDAPRGRFWAVFCRAPQILLDDQPRGTKRQRFIRPDAHKIDTLVTEKAGQLRQIQKGQAC
jgi:hypothetical protein